MGSPPGRAVYGHILANAEPFSALVSRSIDKSVRLRKFPKVGGTQLPTRSGSMAERGSSAPKGERHSHLCSVEDYIGWKICPCWLVPGEELKRDGFDVVLDEILAAAVETGMAERKER